MPELTEKQIQAQIVEYLRWHGWFVSEIRERYSNGTGRYSDPGIPDIVAIKNGRTIWLEVKTPKGKVRPSQIKWHEECIKHGGKVHTVRIFPDDLEGIGNVH